MSGIAKGNNSLDAKNLYDERSFYRSGVYPLYGPKALDLWYDVPLYGKIDHQGDGVFWTGHFAKPITSGDVSNVSVAPDFIAAAFDELKREYAESATINALHDNEGTDSLKRLEIKRGWVDLHSEYRIHMQEFHDLFSLNFLKQKKRAQRMKTFHDYVHFFIEALDLVMISLPVTKTGFLLSRHCSNNVSGLIIEISNGPYADDSVKHQKYINNGNFNMYRNFARKHGFLLDKNAPWRLIADITTTQMKRHMYNAGVSTDDLFEKYYQKVHHWDIDTLKVEMFEFYRQYVEAYPSFQVTTPTRHSTEDCLIKRKPISKVEFEKEYDMNFWLKLYLYLRTKESKLNMGQSQFDAKVRKTQKLFKYRGLTTALDYINMEARRFTERTFEGEGLKPGGHKFIF